MLNIIVFGGYLILLVSIGYVTFVRTKSYEDFTIAGRSNNMWVTAISAESSDMSGWLLLGLPGLAYVAGFGAIWTLIGVIFGTLLNWTIIANRLRTISEHYHSVTLTGYFQKRLNDDKGIINILAAIILVVFMVINASAEVIGSGKLLNVAFGLDYNIGILIAMGIVLIYTFMGGYLAVSWSNLIQGSIIFITLVLVPIVALTKIGGLGRLSADLISQDPNFFNFLSGENTFLGVLGLIIGGLGIGIGYPGQPHILTSFMSIKDPKEIRHSTVIAMLWVALTTYGAVIIGLIGRDMSPALEDPESIFLVLTEIIFSKSTIGLFAAAVMAAILSSVSAYLLVAAASFASDLYNHFAKVDDKKLLWVERVAVIILSVLAYLMSLSGGLVFEVALFAWGGLAASFGPLVIASLYWKNLNKTGAAWSMVIGMATNLVWYYSGLSNWIYELIPAIIFSTIAIIVVSNATGGPDKLTLDQFSQYLTTYNKKAGEAHD